MIRGCMLEDGDSGLLCRDNIDRLVRTMRRRRQSYRTVQAIDDAEGKFKHQSTFGQGQGEEQVASAGLQVAEALGAAGRQTKSKGVFRQVMIWHPFTGECLPSLVGDG